MKNRKKESPVPKPQRALNFHACFTPEGPNPADLSSFAEFWLAAMDHILKSEKKRHSQHRARFAKFQAARDKVHPIMRRALRNELSVESAVRRIKHLVPDQKILREIFDFWQKTSGTTPEQAAEARKDIKQQEKDLATSKRLVEAHIAIMKGLIVLAEATERGNPTATKSLAEAAIQASVLFGIAEKRHPELIKPLAKTQVQWPVLARDEPGWEKEAAQHVASLKLGTEMPSSKVRFRQARGADANLPARRWAKSAVRTIEETKFRCLGLNALMRGFGGAKVMADFCVDTGWTYSPEPAWMRDLENLGTFSVESLPRWKKIVRNMIREQLPDFHTLPEWATQRNSATARGRETNGEIQNAILDDIASAMERIAPPKNVPKSTC